MHIYSVGLHISNCVSQCYDGASVMSGVNTGVKTRIEQDTPHPIYIHCHAHQLNIALVDTCCTLPHASDFFSLLESLCFHVFHSMLLKKQQDLKQNEIRLVKTRWSCRHTSIKAVKKTISAILATLEDISDESGSRTIESRGLLHQIKSFSFLLSYFLIRFSL